jgi:hypothetical protein
MRVTYEFTARDGGKHQRTLSVYDKDEAAANKRLLIYHRGHADQAELVDAGASVDSSGDLQGRPLAALGALIIPASFVAGNLLAARMIFGG